MGNSKKKPTTEESFPGKPINEIDNLRGQVNLFKSQYQSLYQKYQTLNTTLLKIQFEQINTLRYITGRLLQVDCGGDEIFQGQINSLVKELNTLEPKKQDDKTSNN